MLEDESLVASSQCQSYFTCIASLPYIMLTSSPDDSAYYIHVVSPETPTRLIIRWWTTSPDYLERWSPGGICWRQKGKPWLLITERPYLSGGSKEKKVCVAYDQKSGLNFCRFLPINPPFKLDHFLYFSGKSLLSIIHVGFMHYSEEKVSFHLKRKRETLKQEEDSWNKICPTLNIHSVRFFISTRLPPSPRQPDLQHAVWKEMRRTRYCVFIRKYVTPLLWHWHRNI